MSAHFFKPFPNEMTTTKSVDWCRCVILGWRTILEDKMLDLRNRQQHQYIFTGWTHLPRHFNYNTRLVIELQYPSRHWVNNCDGELEYKCVCADVHWPPVQTSLRFSDDFLTKQSCSAMTTTVQKNIECFAAKAQNACSWLVLNKKPVGLEAFASLIHFDIWYVYVQYTATCSLLQELFM